MLQTLGWRLTPTTPVVWLELFMQVGAAAIADTHFFQTPSFSPQRFCLATQVQLY